MKNGNELGVYRNDNLIPYEEFKKYLIDGYNEPTKIMDRLSYGYDKIPQLLKIVAKNVDQTGIISSIDEILSEHKFQQEQERLYKAVYMLYNRTVQNETEIRYAINNLKDEFSALTELYFNKCKESRQLEKIKIFHDVWFNSITIGSRMYDEKEYVFEIVSDLSIDQIKVLKYIYYQSLKNIKDLGRDNTPPIGVNQFSIDNNLNYSYVLQICIDLQGKGLLQPGAGAYIVAQPTHFLPSEYIDTLIEFLRE